MPAHYIGIIAVLLIYEDDAIFIFIYFVKEGEIVFF